MVLPSIVLIYLSTEVDPLSLRPVGLSYFPFCEMYIYNLS